MNKNLTRIFAAFPVPQELQDSYSIYKDQFENIEGVRWTRISNLHLTLFFIGEVETTNLPMICQQLSAIQNSWKVFDLYFEKISYRGKAHSPGMIWAQFQQSANFLRVNREIFSAAKEFMTITPQHAEPIPHITLARLKKGVDLSNLKSQEFKMPEKICVDKMELWKTVHVADGVIYQKVELKE